MSLFYNLLLLLNHALLEHAIFSLCVPVPTQFYLIRSSCIVPVVHSSTQPIISSDISQWCFTKLCCVIFWLVASCWCIFFTICYSSRHAVCTSPISPAYADVVSRRARLAFCTADSVLWLALHSAMHDMWHVTTLHLCHIHVVTYIHIPNYIYIYSVYYIK